MWEVCERCMTGVCVGGRGDVYVCQMRVCGTCVGNTSKYESLADVKRVKASLVHIVCN